MFILSFTKRDIFPKQYNFKSVLLVLICIGLKLVLWLLFPFENNIFSCTLLKFILMTHFSPFSQWVFFPEYFHLKPHANRHPTSHPAFYRRSYRAPKPQPISKNPVKCSVMSLNVNWVRFRQRNLVSYCLAHLCQSL